SVKGGRTDPVFTCDFLNAFTSLEFLKDLTDLLRFESFPFHNTLLKLSIIFYSLTVFFSWKLTTLYTTSWRYTMLQCYYSIDVLELPINKKASIQEALYIGTLTLLFLLSCSCTVRIQRYGLYL